MSITTPITADQLLSMPDQGGRCELVEGELHMMSPSGWRHGRVVGQLHTILHRHILDNQLGVLHGAETGFMISRDPDTVRAPDIAFIAKENLPEEDPTEAFWPGPPDLAVEILSPSDKTGEVDEKIRAWLTAGTQAVWVVDPQLENVTIYHSTTEIQVRTRGQSLSSETLVPGFSCQVDEIFASL